MANELNINWTPIAKKIESMIKDKITSEGLVKSGKLLSSINVISNGDGSFGVEAEDYFKYLDEKHSITESVMNSQELADFIETQLADQITKAL